jgi:hypothetical protein
VRFLTRISAEDGQDDRSESANFKVGSGWVAFEFPAGIRSDGSFHSTE